MSDDLDRNRSRLICRWLHRSYHIRRKLRGASNALGGKHPRRLYKLGKGLALSGAMGIDGNSFRDFGGVGEVSSAPWGLGYNNLEKSEENTHEDLSICPDSRGSPLFVFYDLREMAGGGLVWMASFTIFLSGECANWRIRVA